MQSDSSPDSLSSDSSSDEYEETECGCCDMMCHTECPNSILCGETQIPQCIVDIRDGLCMNCDICIGKKIEVVNYEQPIECTLCMSECTNFVVFPGCANKHEFCVVCTKTMMWGRDTEDGLDREGHIDRCPLCRSLNVPDWDKNRLPS